MEKNEHKENITTFEIRNAFDIKYGRLREWIDRKYIKPSILKASSAHERHKFSKEDVYYILLFDYLLRTGFSRKEAGSKIEDLVNQNHIKPKGIFSIKYIAFYKVCDGPVMKLENIKKFNRYSKVLTTEDATYKNIDSLLSEKGEFQEVVIVNFEKIRQYVDSKIG
jgi:hypothetical protein